MPRVTITSEEHTSELQSLAYLVCRLLLETKRPPLTKPGRTARTAYGMPAMCCRRALTASRLRVRHAHVVCARGVLSGRLVLFLNDTAPTEIYPLALHDALPI